MGPKSRQEWLEAIAPRYRKASRQEKRKILDEFCAVGFAEVQILRSFRNARTKNPAVIAVEVLAKR